MPTSLTTVRGMRMAADLPGYYLTSVVETGLFQATGQELDQLRAAVSGVLSQFFAPATDFDLAKLEADLGLPAIPGLTDDARRARAIAKMKGSGTATVSLVRAVANSFSFGTVEVIEDQTAYAVKLQFVDLYGVPADTNSFQAALRAIVPANLTLAYVFRYATWHQFDGAHLTWHGVDALALTWHQFDQRPWS